MGPWLINHFWILFIIPIAIMGIIMLYQIVMWVIPFYLITFYIWLRTKLDE
jgi:hypothetical protein